MSQKRVKHIFKKGAKKSITAAKLAVKSNKYTLRVARGVRNQLIGPPVVNIYDFYRYYPTIAEHVAQMRDADKFKHKPLISILMPTYNTPAKYLKECIDSVILQSYTNWELCIADDASPDEEVAQIAKSYAETDPRIKFMKRDANGHISEASNSALKMAKGEYVALLDHDDILWPNALYEMVKAINKNPKADFLYSDEDKINSKGTIHSYPFLKPAWSPEFLESCNYITHFSCIRKTIIDEIGGFQVGYEGAQDWDLFLRVAEKTGNIVHIPKILYSWRVHKASTASSTDAKPYVYEAQRKLLEDHIKRNGQKAIIKQGVIKQHCSIEYAVNGNPLVSVIVANISPTQLAANLKSINDSTYKNIEIIVACSSLTAAKAVQKADNIRLVEAAIKPDNLTAYYNLGAKEAKGDYLVFVDDRMIIKEKRWLDFMIGDAQREGIGAVGGKSIDRSRKRIHQAGIAVGLLGSSSPILGDIATDDIHYMRGLYGQSRRNTSAVDGSCFMVPAEVYEKVGGFDESLEDFSSTDFCLKIIDSGLRIVYNPFIEYVDTTKLPEEFDARKHVPSEAETKFIDKWKKTYIKDDPYYNANFTRKTTHLDLIR